MFNQFADAMSITVAGGSAEENQQLCSAINCALMNSGFKNVQVQPGDEFVGASTSDAGLIACLQRINPDLFDTPVIIQGESESDMALQLECMGINTQGMGIGVGMAMPGFTFG